MATTPPTPASSVETRESTSAFGRAVAPLKERHYRDYWFSNALFTGGQQLQMAARSWLVTEITGSRTLLGLSGSFQGAVSLVVSPIGGVIGDRMSQKTLLIWARVGLIGLALLLGFLVLFHQVQIWHVLVISLLAGFVGAISQPAAQTFIYNLVGRDRLTAAVALNSVATGLFQTAFLAMGGVLIVVFSVAGNFFLTAGIFLVAVLLFLGIPEKRSTAPRKARASMWKEAKEGFAIARHDPLVLGCVLLASTTLLSSFPFTLRVVMAKDELHAGATGFGILSAFSALGSVVGSLIIAIAGGVQRKGLLVLVMSIIKEFASIAYGLSNSLWLSAGLDFIMGLYVASFITMLTSMIQLEVPDAVRSRALALFFMGLSAGSFGQLLAGVTADAIGDRWAIVISGIVRMLIVITIFACIPKLRNYGRGSTGISPAPA